ncbi:MAG: DUF5615 family PIN-like protein [Magnetococcales bacterium]|nr:DUF5615 family PIN-like protein [Magnetococcales bacterium]
MKILLDMNLPPSWKETLHEAGFESVHWSEIGLPNASDKAIMSWAKKNEYIIFTHDLDFGTLLALSHASEPSVFQVRTQNVLPKHLSGLVISALKQFEGVLTQGAMVTVDEERMRARILPLRK